MTDEEQALVLRRAAQALAFGDLPPAEGLAARWYRAERARARDAEAEEAREIEQGEAALAGAERVREILGEEPTRRAAAIFVRDQFVRFRCWGAVVAFVLAAAGATRVEIDDWAADRALPEWAEP